MFNGNILIDHGFKAGSNFKLMISRANEIIAQDISLSKEEICKILRNEFPEAPPKLEMRKESVHLSEAITPDTYEEINNVSQVRKFMNELLCSPVVTAGAIMPDACPAGNEPATIPVGGVIKTYNAIIPSSHSADICCSMYASFYEVTEHDVKTKLDILSSVTRFGPGGRQVDDWIHHSVIDEDVWSNPFLKGLKPFAQKHMGDQGDGNHFAFIGEIEFDENAIEALRHNGYTKNFKANTKYHVLVTHHGSRGLGAMLYKRGVIAAKKHTESIAIGVPKQANWIQADSSVGIQYWDALQYIAQWTKTNHEVIHNAYLKKLGATEVETLHNEHNFVWKDRSNPNIFYHGKGATPAGKDSQGRLKLGLIPLNMSEPILVVMGSDNTEFLSFAPHGAGRNISRTSLKNKIGDTEAQHKITEESTQGIDVRWFSGRADVSETPLAYKNASKVKEQIKKFNLAHTLGEIKPLGCIMAGEAEIPFWVNIKNKTN